MENIDHKNGQPSGSKQKESQHVSKEGKKKWEGKEKKTKTTTHHCKDPKNHCNHCKIDGHTEEKCWEIHLELNPNKYKKDFKKNNLVARNSIKELRKQLGCGRDDYLYHCAEGGESE